MYTGPHIVTDGLVFAVDAGSERSYPGSGTTTTSLVGSNTGTLTNGVAFSTDNSGTWDFDNVDDYINLGASSTLGITRYMSVFSNVKYDNVSGWGGIFGNQSGGGFIHFQTYSGTMNVYIYGPNLPVVASTATLVSGTWYNLGFTFDGTTAKIYQDGTALNTGTTSSTTNISSASTMSLGRVYSGDRYFNGNIADLKIYNRGLTAEEVLQNFNAQKSRFGL
jgi:hypothetical protein